MRRLTAAEVQANKVAELGLDQTAFDLTSVEAIAAALRRAASFLCPCAATTLVRAVADPLRGLVEPAEDTRGIVRETLEAMLAHGDFFEHRDIEEDAARGASVLIYTAPPSFVVRESGTAILLGTSNPALDSVTARIEYAKNLRRVNPVPGETNVENNCSVGLPLVVESGGEGSPDLIARLPTLITPNQTTESLETGVTIINLGSGTSAETEVRLYRSENTMIDVTDTLIAPYGATK